MTRRTSDQGKSASMSSGCQKSDLDAGEADQVCELMSARNFDSQKCQSLQQARWNAMSRCSLREATRSA